LLLLASTRRSRPLGDEAPQRVEDSLDGQISMLVKVWGVRSPVEAVAATVCAR
jgi:hypothetical protein